MLDPERPQAWLAVLFGMVKPMVALTFSLALASMVVLKR